VLALDESVSLQPTDDFVNVYFLCASVSGLPKACKIQLNCSNNDQQHTLTIHIMTRCHMVTCQKHSKTMVPLCSRRMELRCLGKKVTKYQHRKMLFA
jgi:hypothetical protein